MTTCCVRAVITGKVQGVWYRRATQEKALQHSLTGHAKNLPDGRVEVLLCGQPEAVKLVSQWLWEGSERAHVTHVELEVLDQCRAPSHFTTH